MNVICVKSNSVGVDSWRCISLDMLQPGQLMVHFVLMSNTLLFYVFKLFCWFRYILKHYKIVAKYLFIFTSSQWPLLQCLGDLFDLVTSPGMTEYHSSGCPHVKDMMWHTEHGVATRPLSTFKQLLALTEKCIFRGEKETFRDWINYNWLMGYWWFLTIQSMCPEQIHAKDCRIDFRILWRIVILFVQISIPAQYKWNKT